MLPDDQMTFDIHDPYHNPVTEENVTRLLNIIFVPPDSSKAYEACVTFFEPLPWECEIIKKVVGEWCKK